MTDSIFALDAATGDIAWSARTPGNEYKMTAPVWSGDDSWFGSEPTPVEIDWRSGKPRWTTEPLGNIWYPAIYSVPALSAQHVYFSFYGTPGALPDGFSVVDRASGTLVHTENGSFRSPIWTGSTLYLVGGRDLDSQRLSARDAFGNVIWTSPVNLGRSTGAPALGNDVIVVPGNFGAVEGLSATDGSRL
jgi:outer membrane protein assembly factor BamB